MLRTGRDMAGRPIILTYWGGGLEHAGGIGRMAGNLLRARAGAGRGERVLCLDTRGPHSILLSPLFLAAALLRTAVVRATNRRVIAHVHMADGGSTVRKVIVCHALAVLRVPYLLHLHPGNYDTYFRALGAPGKRLVRGAFAAAAAVVVLGTRWRRLVVDEIGVAPRRVRVVFNGAADPGAPRATPPREAPRILFLGEFAPWKGIAELIAALGRISDRPWRLVCAGRGDWAEQAVSAANAGLAGRVQFLGWVDRTQAAALLRDASIVAVPSFIEGFSVTLIEALASGIAVVATPVGAHPDVLRHGENAMLAPPGDVTALADALAALLDDPERRAAIGRAGRATFEAHLDIRTIESQFADIYAELLAATHSSARAPVRLGDISRHESIP